MKTLTKILGLGMLISMSACAPRQYTKPSIMNTNYTQAEYSTKDPVQELEDLDFGVGSSTDTMDSETRFWKSVQDANNYPDMDEPKAKITPEESEKADKQLQKYRKDGFTGK